MRSSRQRATVELCSSEEEVVRAVTEARRAGQTVRVVGSGHSYHQAIWPEGGRVRRISLDPMRGVRIHREGAGALVEVDAGCRLGRDPLSPSSTWSNGLNAQLQAAGLALPDLGGISHQSVAGFLSTGSSGGSVKYSVYDAVERVRFVDGTGRVHELSRGQEQFGAAIVSLGLLGVITRVWLRAEPSYDIVGREVISKTSQAEIDFFGRGGPRPDLETFLRETEYTRLMWWPQSGFDRMTVWQAERRAPVPDFQRKPYLELGKTPRLASLAGCLVYTIIGNLEDLSKVPDKLDELGYWELLDEMLDQDPDPNACHNVRPHGRHELAAVIGYIGSRLRDRAAVDPRVASRRGLLLRALARAGKKADSAWDDRVSNAVVRVLELLLDGALDLPTSKPLGRMIARAMPHVIDEIIWLFVQEGRQDFADSWMCGLPMDNQMDDRLWKTEFTELWVPLERTREVMCALRDFYRGDGDPKTSYERTGAFSCELYAAKKSDLWLSPSYGTDVFRVDVFWFGYNAGDPNERFYPQFYRLLESFDFRPHWGKVLPPPARKWREHYRKVLPKLDAFLALRSELDPDGVFATPYWREHLGF